MNASKKVFAALLLSTALLAACQEQEVDKDIAEEAVEETEKAAIDVPSQAALVTLVDQHITGILAGLNTATEEFNLSDGTVTDAIYEAMKARFTNFGTTSYIDGDLKLIAKGFCYLGCDMAFFPMTMANALHVELEQLNDETVKLAATHPADMMTSEGYQDIVTLKYDDGLWKIDEIQHKTVELQLSKEQAQQVLANWGYEGATFVEEIETTENDKQVKAYRFDAQGQPLLVSAVTGYVEEGVQQVEKPATPSTSKLYNKYEAKIAEATQQVEDLGDAFTGYTTVEINEHMNEIVNVWDGLLNDMYQALKANLPENEFAALKAEQRQWIKERDAYAEKTATEEAEGGTMYTMVYLSAISDYTEQRCSDFLYDYMTGR